MIESVDPAVRYAERAERFERERDVCAAASQRLSLVRVLVFAALVAAGLWLERRPGLLPLLLTLSLLVLFIVLVARHRRVRARERWLGELAALNREGVARIARNWDALPRHEVPPAAFDHGYAADLDLFGRAAVTQVLGSAGSAAGAATLEQWLLGRAAPDVVAARQEAVRELAADVDLRETLVLHARRTRAARAADVEQFLRWAGSDPWLTQSAWLSALAWLLPLATWSLIALHALGIIDRSLWMLPLLASLVVYFTTGARVRRSFDDAFGREALFTHYPPMIATVSAASFRAPLLQSLHARLVQHGDAADAQLARLQRLMHLADLRASSMHLPVFLVTLWDLHILRALEQWQRAAGHHARDWLAALGEVEALSCIATLAHDEPAWCWPVVTDAADSFDATRLGHPLLRDDTRVGNDVVVGPAGTVLLVTGSNMSGKSTLLRSIGLNAVLAQLGAPVCATSLRMPPLDVRTSIRVQDSLARGVSYFMAELERLKTVVDAAHRAEQPGGARVLFLLDEILHGTNTAERRVAARRVIRHLVDAGAIGAATTHDLELATEPEIADVARLVHFQESFVDDEQGDTRLTFDYVLLDGIATSTNALVLMKLVGLP